MKSEAAKSIVVVDGKDNRLYGVGCDQGQQKATFVRCCESMNKAEMCLGKLNIDRLAEWLGVSTSWQSAHS